MRFATNGSVSLAYDVGGEGPPLLLIHGLGYCRLGWGPVTRHLADRFQVVHFDNRGVGDSDAPRGPYTVNALTDDALAVLDHAGIERAHVVGVSLGGLIAQTLAAGRPDRVDRLVLVASTSGGARSYPPPRSSLLLMTQAAALARDELLRRLVVNALSPLTVERRPELVDEILDYRRRRAPGLGPWLSQAAAGAWFGLVGRAGAIEAPTLVIHGAADRVVDPRNAELLARSIAGAELQMFEHAGHLLFWEEPERFVSLLGRFLGRAAAAA